VNANGAFQGMSECWNAGVATDNSNLRSYDICLGVSTQPRGEKKRHRGSYPLTQKTAVDILNLAGAGIALVVEDDIVGPHHLFLGRELILHAG